jgi:hypothetical protein
VPGKDPHNDRLDSDVCQMGETEVMLHALPHCSSFSSLETAHDKVGLKITRATPGPTGIVVP